MWIVRLALRRPFTTVCMAILMLLIGGFAGLSMPADIFPSINLPVVSIVWGYNGLPPQEMERRMVYIAERAYTTSVSDIEHMESESLAGVAIIRVYLQPNANVQSAVAEITAASQAATRQMPPGTTPPFIIQFNATDVPILELGVASDSLGDQELNDVGNNFVRPQLVTAQGATVPPVFGGPPKQINVDLDIAQMYAEGLSPADVTNALNAQNVILPSGTAKMGAREYVVLLNSSPDIVKLLDGLPVKQVNGRMIYVRDVAHVWEGAGVQTNIVRQNGRRGAYIEILKTGSASSLKVVKEVRGLLPLVQASIPASIKLSVIEDQTIYVRNAISGVIREGVIAACLTALMILLFLGSWRSTLIVALSIPLSILTSIICLWALGQTINIMTLGGLALAVGILVDDATVEIENMTRNLSQGKDLTLAILDGASQIAVPAFVSSISICIVFVPVFFLSGPAASLFRPLAMAVIFAILASYLLSRTLVPTMARFMLHNEAHLYQGAGADERRAKASWGFRVNGAIDRGFERFRDSYHVWLGSALEHRVPVLIVTALFCIASGLFFVPRIGQDFFPTVDAGALRLHIRAPAGTRLEETERIFAAVEGTIRRTIPAHDLSLMLDDIGLAGGGVALAIGDQATLGPADGEILVVLATDRHGKTGTYQLALQDSLATEFPTEQFFFQPADIVSQILNLGLPAPIDVQVTGRAATQNYAIAQRIAHAAHSIPGASDVRVQQVVDVPQIFYTVDRARAQQLGLTERDVASSLLISLSSSFQTAPNFWLDPTNGVNYTINVETPQYDMTSLQDIARTPVTGAAGGQTPQLFANLATAKRELTTAVATHYNIQPTFDVYLGADGRDLGSIASEINGIVARERAHAPRGTTLTVRGQAQSMRTSFIGLGLGIVAALVLIYIILVINFQSWGDPFVIIMALPGALAGVLWILYALQTSFSIPSLMGTIMCLGVATSNSVLLITFADDQRKTGRTAIEAALDAGYVRLRPVIMTALAMIIGMFPMSLGLGDGGEQNAPLGRAVIGGLLVASVFTLVIVPVMYTLVRTKPPRAEEVLPDVTPMFEPAAAAKGADQGGEASRG